MRLAELAHQYSPTPDFDRFLIGERRRNMPPLRTGELAMRVLVGQSAGIATPVSDSADATFVLTYKNTEGAILSLREANEGQLWQILQVQGAKSQVSFRLCSGLLWAQCLADSLYQLAAHPDSEVQYLTISRACDIDCTIDSPSEYIGTHYRAISTRFGMRWSEENKMYIAEMNR